MVLYNGIGRGAVREITNVTFSMTREEYNLE